MHQLVTLEALQTDVNPIDSSSVFLSNVGVDTESAKLRVAGEKKSVKERIER